MALRISITTPDGLVYQGEGASVVVPAADGELGIYPLHAPLIGRLGVGELRVRPATGDTLKFFLSGGFVQVLKDQVLILATQAQAGNAIAKKAVEAELESLRKEPLPPRTSIEARQTRSDRIRGLEKKLKIAAK